MIKVYHDARDAIFQELYSIALKDPNVLILTADTGAMAFEEFKRNIPRQFINVGVAEQNMISVAAGLSLTGIRVFVYGISNFVTLRCFEQIRIDICSMKLPVIIIGMGTGYVYSADGPTHHVTEDVAVMRALPHMTIWSLSDYTMTASIIHLAYEANSPCYIRLDKGPFTPIYHHMNADFSKGVSVLRKNNEITIVATGVMVTQALKVIKELKKNGKDAGLIDLYRLKPVNEALLIDSLKDSKLIVTLEEHTVVGGLGSIICEKLLANSIFIPVKMLGIPDKYRCEVGSREMLRSLDGTDVTGIVKSIMEWTQ